MAVRKGKVIERKLFIEVEGEKYYMPKGCDPIIGPQLEMVAGQEIELLMTKDVILALRAKSLIDPHKIIVITCYLCPPFIVFEPEIMRKIEPLITESLLQSGYLDKGVVEQLNGWKAGIG